MILKPKDVHQSLNDKAFFNPLYGDDDVFLFSSIFYFFSNNFLFFIYLFIFVKKQTPFQINK